MRYALGLLVLVSLIGCDDPPIEHYRAPKQARPTLIDAAPQVAAAKVDTPMTWTAPEGWLEKPDPGQMRVASFTAGDGAVEVAITVFPGDVGGTLANVNRWRQQLNLSPVTSLNEEPIRAYAVQGRDVYEVTYPGLIAAGVADGEQTWFIKMTGDVAAVTQQAEAFDAFVQSLRWEDGGAP